MEKSHSVQDSIGRFRRGLAILIVLGTIVGLIVSLALFFLEHIDELWLLRGIVSSLCGFLIALIIYKMPTGWPRYEPNRARTLTKISFIFLGGFFGGAIAFFGAGFLLIQILGGPIPGGLLGNAFLFFAWVIAPIIGGFIGYVVFKRSKYSDPSLYSGYS
jgi:hypothetical protein